MKFAVRLATIAGVLLVGLPAKRADASVITFTLDCTIVSSTTCTAGGSFGTIRLTDNGNAVDFLITMSPSANIDVIALNWDSGQGALPIAARWTTPAFPGVNITAQLDDSGPTQRFDIRINPDNSPLPPNPLAFTLLLDSGAANIDAAFFNVKDDVSQLYAGVVLLPNTAPQTAYGASSTQVSLASVPEPSSMILLGTGTLVGLGLAARRH